MAALILIPLVMGAVFAFIGYSIAKGKGREPVLWAVICFLFGLIGVIIIAVLPDQDRGGRYSRGGYGGRDRGSRRGGGRDYGRGSRRSGGRDRGYGGRSRSPRAGGSRRPPARRPRR